MSRRAYVCPACHRPVWLRDPVGVVTATGTVLIDAQPLADALSLHLRVGCEVNS